MVATPIAWNLQAQLNATDAGDQDTPAVIPIGNGRYLVAWVEDDGSNAIAPSPGDDIVGQIFDALGRPIGPEFQINQSFFGDGERDIALAPRPGGGFVAVYVDDGGADSIRIEHYDINGVKIALPSTIANGGGDDLDAPQIAMAANGTWLVTYEREHGGGDTDIVGAIVNADGSIGAEFLIASDSEDMFEPSVAALSNGTFVVAYENEYLAGANTFIGFRIVTPGSPPTVGGQVVVDNLGSTVDQDDAKVAALDNGGFVVVYADNASGNDDIRAAVYDNAGNVVKAAFTVNNEATGGQNEPAVAALRDGGFVIVWDDDNAGLLMGQRFDAAGNEVGAEFIAGSSGEETNPTITVLEDGRFIVGFEQETGDDDVWGTIFDPRDEDLKGTGDGEMLIAFATGGEVKGKGGDDKLLGSSSGDQLKGGGGSDYLVGMGGNDRLKGGGDTDFFVFATALDKKLNVDQVEDFSRKQKDKILLLDDIFGAIGPTLDKSEFRVGSEAKDSDDFIIAKIKPGKGKATLFYDADGDGAGAQVKFAKVTMKDGVLNHKSFTVIADLDI